MRAKFVNENIGDILKPKTIEDIKKDNESLFRWKNIIDGKRSPEYLNFILDKDFIKEKAKEFNLKNPIKKWEKDLVFFFDKLYNAPEDQFTNRLRQEIEKYMPTSNLNIFYVINNFIESQFKKIDYKYKKLTGKGLMEEKIGDYHWRDKKGKSHFIEVYKNPKNITKMSPKIRAISDNEGNLYLIDKQHMLHQRLLDYLHNNGIMLNAIWNSDNHHYLNMIAWQRLNNTNKMYLGETYSENRDVIGLPWFQELIKKTKAKNPNIEFIEKTIYDVKNV